MLGASPPRLKKNLQQDIPKQGRTDSKKQIEEEKESKLQNGHARNESEADDPLLLLHLNETLIKSNVTALPARRFLKEETKSAKWWLSSWLTGKE